MPADSTAQAPGPRRSATALVQAGILLSRVAGLVRERVIAHYLGLSDAAGAFSAALRIPNFLQTLFGEGALSASFIPVYSKLLEEKREDEARHLAGVVVSLLALTVGTIALLGAAFARPIIDVIAPGFQGDVRELTIRLVAIMFPGVALLVLSAWCLGILNSHRRFFLSYAAPVLWNVAMIAALFAFGGPRMSTRVGQMDLARLLAWATVVGSAAQLGIMVPQTLRLAGGVRPSLSLASASVRRVIGSFGPAVLTRGVVQVSAYIDQVLASFLGTAAVAAMQKAQILYLLPVSLFGMAISAAELPEMSSALGSSEEVAAKLRERLQAALRRMAFFVVPSAAAFLALGAVLASLLFQTGKFGAEDAQLVWMILAGSAVGLLAATQARLLASAFWALGDTRTPLGFAMVRVALTAAGGYLAALPLREHFGYAPGVGAAGLTASAGVAGWIEYALLRRGLMRRIGRFSVGGHAIARAWGAAIVAAGIAYAANRYIPFSTGVAALHDLLAALHIPNALRPGVPLVAGAVVVGIYGVVYFGATAALGLPEGKAMLGRVGRLLRRR